MHVARSRCRLRASAPSDRAAPCGFILPSLGRTASAPLPHDQTCDSPRHSAIDRDAGHSGRSLRDRGTKSWFIPADCDGELVSAAGVDGRTIVSGAAARSLPAELAVGPGFAANRVLDHPRWRSPPDCWQTRAFMTFGWTARTQVLTRVIRSMATHSHVGSRGAAAVWSDLDARRNRL